MHHWTAYSPIDIAFAALLVVGLIQGLRRGLSGEIARLIGLMVAVWAGWHYYHPLGLRLQESTHLSAEGAHATAFVLALLGLFLLFLVLRLLLGCIMQVTFKGAALERAGGALAGMLRICLACAAIVFFVSLVPDPYLRRQATEVSLFGRFVTDHLPRAWHAMRGYFPALPALPQPAETPSDPSRDRESAPDDPHASPDHEHYDYYYYP